ncbi:MAG: RidA family protein, partial [Spongiibacteraceae bacterium]|nr:RidA family protein [Spongiibacteraceae bacterium]
ANQAIDPEGLLKLPGFHQVMTSTASKTIYIAGQVAYDRDMTLVGVGDYRAQTIQALQNVAIAVRAAGAEPEDIVSSTLHIRGLNTEGAAQAIMEGMAVALDGKPFPAHAFSMIGVETLADPRILIEISAVAQAF